MLTILVVEDDRELRQLFNRVLTQNGYFVREAENGKAALDALEQEYVDLIISDIMMPVMDGYELVRSLRDAGIQIPVLMITAKDAFDDMRLGFLSGTDDYMVKPFIAQEFVWRITAILRRTYKESEETSFLLNSCKVDLEQAEVYKEGQEPVTLTAKEVGILKKLYANAGRIVTLGALCQAVCGDIYIGYEKTLMSHIRHIREKIEEEPSSPVSLITVKGIGYKLVLKDKTR